MAPIDELLSQLRATLGKMEVALGAIAESIVWVEGKTGRVQWCNTAFSQLVGKSYIKLLGTPMAELLSLTQQDQPLAPEAHPWNLLVKTDIVHGEYGCQTAHQPLVLEVSAVRVHFGGSESSVVLLLRDITERKQAENALKRAKEDAEHQLQIMLGREERVLELKQEVNALLKQAGQEPKYGV